MRLLFYILSCFPVLIFSQDISGKEYISGYVSEILEDGSIISIQGANIVWEGTNNGSISNEEGFYKIKSPNSYPAVLTVSFVGYETYRKNLNIWKQNYDIVLNSTVKIDQVNIRKNIESTTSSVLDPINNLTLSNNELEKAACCNLSEAFETTSSVDVVLTDGIAGTKKIRMLALDGFYTQITQENIPFIRGASSSFGITYIPGTWIESIQIAKGSSSVINGTESLTGQINIELYKPETGPRLLWNGHVNNEGKVENNLLITKQKGNWRSNLFAHLSFLNYEVDHHGSLHDHSNHSDIHGSDGFLDVPKHKNINLLNRWKYYGSDNYNFQILARLIIDDRLSGTTKNANEQYNVDIHNDLQEISGKLGILQPGIEGKSIGTQYSFRRHFNSYRINTSFKPTIEYTLLQESAYINIIRQTYLYNKDDVFKYGFSSFLERYHHSESLIFSSLDMPIFNSILDDRLDLLPGFFSEYSLLSLEDINIIAGYRAEYYNNTNKIYSVPRIHLKYNPNKETALRFSLGRSLRIPNIISDNTHLLFSNRELGPMMLTSSAGDGVIPSNPEIAWNYGVNLSYCFYLFNREGSINIDLYRTVFEQKVIVDIETPLEVDFYLLDGESYSNVLESLLSYELWYNLDVKLAYKFNNTYQTYNHVEKLAPLNPKEKFLINFGYDNDTKTWAIDATCNYIGKSRVPSYLDNHNQLIGEHMSNSFYKFNTQVTRYWDNFDLYLGIENITDVTQDNPILHAHDPSSPSFDAGLIYGPVMGRMFYLGFRYKID